MKHISFALLLLLTILVHSGCKKDLDDGGVRFSFVPTGNYENVSMNLYISNQQYGPAITQMSSAKAERVLQVSGLQPRKYHWDISISYHNSQVSGSFSFRDDIIIEKGEIKNITIEY